MLYNKSETMNEPVNLTGNKTNNCANYKTIYPLLII